MKRLTLLLLLALSACVNGTPTEPTVESPKGYWSLLCEPHWQIVVLTEPDGGYTLKAEAVTRCG